MKPLFFNNNKGKGKKTFRAALTWISLFSLGLFLSSFILSTKAQCASSDIETFIKKLSEDAAKMYVGPVVTAFGSNLNGGWFHRAPHAKIFGLNIEFGLVGMGTLYKDADKHFSINGQFRFNQTQAALLIENINLSQNAQDALIEYITSQEFNVVINGATVVGVPEDYIKVVFGGDDLTFMNPDTGQPQVVSLGAKEISLDFGGIRALNRLSFFPLVAPQVSVGTVLGTQAVFRYLPSIRILNLGKFKYFGWGIQHNPEVWLKLDLPVNVAAGFFHQTLNVSDIFTAETNAFGLSASKRLGLGVLNVTPYAGFMLEFSSINVSYDFQVDDLSFPIEFSQEGDNKYRLILGLSARVLFLNINADINLGKYTSFTVGAMFAL